MNFENKERNIIEKDEENYNSENNIDNDEDNSLSILNNLENQNFDFSINDYVSKLRKKLLLALYSLFLFILINAIKILL